VVGAVKPESSAVSSLILARHLLAVTFFLGGLARVVSMLAVGLPHPLFSALTLLELGLPPIIWWLMSQVSRESQLVRSEL
jgi:Domain of unknown function (DUF4345)